MASGRIVQAGNAPIDSQGWVRVMILPTNLERDYERMRKLNGLTKEQVYKFLGWNDPRLVFRGADDKERWERRW